METAASQLYHTCAALPLLKAPQTTSGRCGRRPPQCRSSVITTTMSAQPTAAVDGERHRVLIIGGGTGGVGVAAQLRGKGVTDICIVEPAETHYYQVCGWGDNLTVAEHEPAQIYIHLIPTHSPGGRSSGAASSRPGTRRGPWRR